MAGGVDYMSFKAPSSPNYSVISVLLAPHHTEIDHFLTLYSRKVYQENSGTEHHCGLNN